MGRLATVQPNSTLRVTPFDAVDGPGAFPELNDAIIRIRPEQIVSFGVNEPDRDPHELTSRSRKVI